MAASALVIMVVVCLAARVAEGQGLVPAVMIFGDSVVDAGNNNYLLTLVKSNFPPYGRDFGPRRSPTGRFRQLTSVEKQLERTFLPAPTLPLPPLGTWTGLQIFMCASIQSKVENIVGRAKAAGIFSGAINILSAGSSDYVQNYYINPLINEAYTPDQFSYLLVRSFKCDATPSQNLYSLGARRIGVTSLPPTGCLPAAITLFGGGSNNCVDRLNNDAVAFNKKLSAAADTLKKSYSDLKLVIFDVYNPLLDLVKNPGNNGFFEARKACCGTGTIETSLLCNARSPGTCANATGYVFWDSFHPSEAANKILADALLLQGIELIF